MAIFLNENSRIIVQGMTGSEGMKHTRRMLLGGSNIVGGVNPRKAGEVIDVEGKNLPVFGTVKEAMEATGANVTVIFVPPAFAKAAMIEAIDAEIELAVAITEGIPVHDSAEAWAYNLAKGEKTRLIGPNCPGIISPEKSNAPSTDLIGILPTGGFVILDSSVTPELAAEGLARDVIRGVQQARKDADFDVSDRIRLSLTADEAVLAAVAAHEELVKGETLALELHTTEGAASAVAVGDGQFVDIVVVKL